MSMQNVNEKPEWNVKRPKNKMTRVGFEPTRSDDQQKPPIDILSLPP